MTTAKILKTDYTVTKAGKQKKQSNLLRNFAECFDKQVITADGGVRLTCMLEGDNSKIIKTTVADEQFKAYLKSEGM